MQELILNCPWGEAGGKCDAAMSEISRLRALRKLDVSFCPLFTTGANAVMRSVATLPLLCCLRVRACGLDNEACTHSAVPALRKLTSLESIMIGGSRVDTDGAGALARAMSGLTRLSCLRLEYQPGPEQLSGVEAVAALQRQLTRLCRLDLQLMGVGKAACVAARTLFSCHVTELCVRS
jgi:hypothetical protein